MLLVYLGYSMHSPVIKDLAYDLRGQGQDLIIQGQGQDLHQARPQRQQDCQCSGKSLQLRDAQTKVVKMCKNADRVASHSRPKHSLTFFAGESRDP